MNTTHQNIINRPKPISEQVLSILRERIYSGYYDIDKRMPSENELATELSVSRSTIRIALTTLEREMMITRRQGDGTYINERLLNINNNFGKILDFNRHIEASGFTSAVKGIYLNHNNPSIQVAEALHIEPTDSIVNIGRLFYADRFPVILSHNTIPENIINSNISIKDINQSLPQFVRQYCDIEFTYGITELQSVLPDDTTQELLEIDAHTPVLRFSEVFYSKEDEPVVFATNYYNDKIIKLLVARLFN